MSQTSLFAPEAARHLVCLDLVERDAECDQGRIDRCRRLLTYGRCAGWSITHLHPRTMAGSRRPRPPSGLGPLPSEPVLYRQGGSAFSNRTFDRIIREQEDAELVILSLTLSSACLAVAVYAHELGIPVILVEDALSGSAVDGLDAIATLGRSMRTPFVQVAAVDGLIEPSRGLRLVHG